MFPQACGTDWCHAYSLSSEVDVWMLLRLFAVWLVVCGYAVWIVCGVVGGVWICCLDNVWMESGCWCQRGSNQLLAGG